MVGVLRESSIRVGVAPHPPLPNHLIITKRYMDIPKKSFTMIKNCDIIYILDN